jgi:hypothetical protein
VRVPVFETVSAKVVFLGVNEILVAGCVTVVTSDKHNVIMMFNSLCIACCCCCMWLVFMLLFGTLVLQ